MPSDVLASLHVLFSLLHGLSGAAIAIGVLLLLFWAWKSLTAKQLKHWGTWLFLGGIAVCLVTTVLAHGLGLTYGPMMRMKMHRIMQMDGAMTMDDMVMTLQGKTGDDLDRAFLSSMVPHHEGAIAMARVMTAQAKHPELKRMAQEIITAQQREIDQMKGWEKAWGYTL